MRKTFTLQREGRHRDRVVEAVKHEIRKYVRRERRVPLPEGADFWDFDCRFGADKESAEPVHFATITERIDAVAAAGGLSFYLELLARPARRAARQAPDDRVADQAPDGQLHGQDD